MADDELTPDELKRQQKNEYMRRFAQTPAGKAAHKRGNARFYAQSKAEKEERRAEQRRVRQEWSDRYKAEHPAAPPAPPAFKPKPKPPPGRMPWLIRPSPPETPPGALRYDPSSGMTRQEFNRQVIASQRAKEVDRRKGSNTKPVHPWWRKV